MEDIRGVAQGADIGAAAGPRVKLAARKAPSRLTAEDVVKAFGGVAVGKLGIPDNYFRMKEMMSANREIQTRI